MTLRCNQVHGELSFDEAVKTCNMLVELGRAIHHDQWVPALAERAQQAANGQWLAAFLG